MLFRSDNEALLKELQTKLATMQREESTALANKMLELQTKSTQLETLITEAMNRGEDTTTLKEQLQANSIEMSRTSTAQQTFGNADAYVKLQKEITTIQEQISNYEKYKAEMETQKATTENSILDTYQKEEISANKQIEQLTFDDMADTYQSATLGVLAEFEGIITECNVGQGSAVMPGTQLFTLQSSNNVKVEFLASKYDLEKLKLGQKGIVTILGNQYEGEVSKINRAATTGASGTPMVGIEMHIVNPDDRIILGLDAKLEIVTNVSSKTLLVPVEAINADKEGDFLYVNENGVVVKKVVVCGISSDTYVEIKDGISIDDEIIISALTNVEEGMTTVIIATE